MALTVNEMQEVLSEISYFPKWDLTIYVDPFEGPHLEIQATVPDSYNIGQSIDLGIHSAIPPMPNVETFVDWLDWRLLRIAVHEHREFFMYQGKKLSDPHVETAAELHRRTIGS